MSAIVRRRIIGTVSVLLILALGYLGMRWRYSPPSGSYEVTAVLGRAGSGLQQGSDVKVRGVAVGEVAGIRYEDAKAIATLRIDPDIELPAPEDLEVLVTAKTLLGEKQVEIRFPDERYGTGPFLAAGDRLQASQEPTELQEVLDELEPFIDSLEPEDLGAIIEAFGAQQGEGARIAENIELGQQLAAFGAETAAASLENLRNFANVTEALEPRAADFNRLNDNLPAATSLIPDRQAAVRTNLAALSRFAVGFAEFLEADEKVIGRLLVTGDVVGAVLERNANQIGSLIEGVYLYALGLGKHNDNLTDGTEWAGFRIMLDDRGLQQLDQICAALPQAPACHGGGGADG